MIFHLHISRVQTVALFLFLPLARKFAFIHKKEGEQACGRRKSVGKASNDERGKRKTIKRQAATRRRRRQTRQPGVLSENRGGAEKRGDVGGKSCGSEEARRREAPKFFGRSQFSLSLLLRLLLFALFILIHIALVSMSVFWAGKSLSLCASYFYLFSFYPTRLKTKHEASKKNECRIFVTFYYKHKRGNKKKFSNNRTGKRNKTSNTAGKLLSAQREIVFQNDKLLRLGKL